MAAADQLLDEYIANYERSDAHFASDGNSTSEAHLDQHSHAQPYSRNQELRSDLDRSSGMEDPARNFALEELLEGSTWERESRVSEAGSLAPYLEQDRARAATAMSSSSPLELLSPSSSPSSSPSLQSIVNSQGASSDLSTAESISSLLNDFRKGLRLRGVQHAWPAPVPVSHRPPPPPALLARSPAQAPSPNKWQVKVKGGRGDKSSGSAHLVSCRANAGAEEEKEERDFGTQTEVEKRGSDSKLERLVKQCKQHLASLNDFAQHLSDLEESTLTIVGAVPYASRNSQGRLLRPDDLVSEAEVSVYHAGLPLGLWD